MTDVTHSLGLTKKDIGLENTLSKIVKNFRNSERIKKSKESQQAAGNSSFSIKVISEEEVQNAIKDLTYRDIPTKFGIWQIFLMNL